MILIGLLSFLLQAAFPVPTGEYAVGRTNYYWVDESRDEIYTEDANDHRELMAVVWYPAEVAEGATPAPWLDEELLEPMADALGFEASELIAESGAYLNATPLEGSFPVLVMSHADSLSPWFYTSFAQELASHGYVVVGVTHPYNDPLVLYPDGRTALADPEAQSAGADIVRGSSFTEQFDALWDHNSVMLDVWAEDLRFVVDQLESLGEDDPLAGKLDLSKVGAFGHSFGGAAVFEALSRDARFVAGASLDGSPSNLYENGISQPILFFSTAPLLTPEALEQYRGRLELSEEELAALMPRLLRAEWLLSESPMAYRVVIDGATHMTYSDFPILDETLPMGSEFSLEALDPEYALGVISDVMLEFFDDALNGEEIEGLDTLPYPQLQIERPQNLDLEPPLHPEEGEF